jgi:hypothetical protein
MDGATTKRKPIIAWEGKDEEIPGPQVYIVKSSGGYKIGSTTKDAYKRLESLQTGNESELSLIMTIKTSKHKETEKLLHEFFKEKHIRGEWFALNDDDLVLIQNAFTALAVRKLLGF